jgi:excisionase family DNA binding protein
MNPEPAKKRIAKLDRITVRVPDAVKMLGLGRSKIYQFIGSGEIKVIKIGRATLIEVASLREFIENRRTA